jgi:hypothetical protein
MSVRITVTVNADDTITLGFFAGTKRIVIDRSEAYALLHSLKDAIDRSHKQQEARERALIADMQAAIKDGDQNRIAELRTQMEAGQ